MTFSIFFAGLKWVVGILLWCGGGLLVVMLAIWGFAELIDYVRSRGHGWFFKD